MSSCRHCHCTEASPCRLEAGEECVINCRTGVCSNPRCQMAETERLRNQPKPKREHPFRVIERDERGRAIRIVRNRKYKRAS